jgi:hypothetical protein
MSVGCIALMAFNNQKKDASSPFQQNQLTLIVVPFLSLLVRTTGCAGQTTGGEQSRTCRGIMKKRRRGWIEVKLGRVIG